jgi:ABC-2 type transport system permease protein
MKLFRAWTTLVWLSFRRLLWSANTLMVLLPLAVCFLVAMHRHARDDYAESFQQYSDEFVMPLVVSFIVPVCALAYATSSIGGDREDRTLLFLLVRPIPRWLVLVGKWCATLPIAVGLVAASYWGYCRLAGEVGERAWELYLPAVFSMTIAYIGLFHLFTVCFRHSTIVALIYALFMEGILGNMPGIVKRVAINFYGRSMIYDMGAADGLGRPDPAWFVPVSAQAGMWTLLGVAFGGLVLALMVFQRREYRDLT